MATPAPGATRSPSTAGTITQTAPTSGSTTTARSSTFTDQLATTGNIGPVTFTETTGDTAT